MPNINMQSILNKAKKFTSSSDFKKKIEQKTDEAMLAGGTLGGKPASEVGASMAAAKFIEVLQNTINSHAIAEGGGGLNGRGLGATAISTLTQLEHGAPYKIGKNKYEIEVWFSDDLHRDSLAPDYYDGIENIAALLNKGYSAAHTVFGIWLNHGYAGSFNIPSLQEREGLHFIEEAIRDYMANYSSEYGVTDIMVDNIYN